MLQALPEGIVTPAQSRETFPAQFVTVCTSNLDDLAHITEPLNDRLVNVHITFSKEYWKNRMVINLYMRDRGSRVFIPEVIIEAAVHLTQAWRSASGGLSELSEVGSNRAMIDIVLRSESYALIRGSDHVSTKDFQKGALQAMLGRIRARGADSYAQNKDRIEKFVQKNSSHALRRAGTNYWCRFYRDDLKEERPEGLRVLDESHKILKNRQMVRGALGTESTVKKFRKFGTYAIKKETLQSNLSDEDVAFHSFGLLAELDVFECEDDVKRSP